MLSKLKRIDSKIWFFIFSSIVFTALLSFTSPFMIKHSYVDDNAFLTVGRVLKHGGTLYKDVFEQKGPLFLFLFYLQELVSEKYYVVLFAINVILNFALILYSYKFVFEFTNSSAKSYFVAAIMSGIYYALPTSMLVPESFIYVFFVYIVYTLYINTKYEKFIFTRKQNFVNGLFIAFTLFSKFILTFSFVLLYFAIIVIYIMNKKYKELIRTIIATFLGFIVLTLPVIIYFVSKNYLSGFINDYVIVNYKYYGTVDPDTFLSSDLNRKLEFPSSLIKNLFRTFSNYFRLTSSIQGVYIKIISIVSIVFLFIKSQMFKNNYVVLILVLTFGYIYGEYFGAFSGVYYELPGFSISLVLFAYIINKIKFSKFSKVYFVLLTLIVSISIMPSIWVNSNLFRDNRQTENEFFTSYVLSKKSEPKIVQLTLDQGSYLSTKTLPMSKFFYVPTGFTNYDDLWNTNYQLIKNKRPDYIIGKMGDLSSNKQMQPIMKDIIKSLKKNYRQVKLKNRPKLDDKVISWLWEKK